MRFYGGSVEYWLDQPPSIFSTFYSQIDSIQAEESLHKVSIIALGNGLVKKDERNSILRRWRKIANIIIPKKKTTLADTGMGVRTKKKNNA